MTRYVFTRILQSIGALLLMTVVVFFLARLTGNPLDVIMPENASEADYAAASVALGLDKPVYEQYGIFMWNMAHGDFGKSIFTKGPVMDVILDRFPATLVLGITSMLGALIAGALIGVTTAVWKNTWYDRLGKVVSVLGQSAPTFWLGIMLMLLFAVQLRWVPVAGYGKAENLILPAVTIGYHQLAGIMRITRSSMLDVLDTEWVKLLRVKGLPERLVVWKHAARNASLPVLTFVSMQFLQLLMGAIIVETVFNWPGIGLLAYQSVLRRDFPMMQGLLLFVAAMMVVGNLAVDLAYGYLDPRIRYVKK